jgi:hypothetical protein
LLRELTTASGERERDRCGRGANLAEAIAVFAWIQLGLWGLVARGGERAAEALGSLVLGAALVYCGFAGPRWHGDSLADLGLPRPRANFARLRARAPLSRGERRAAAAAAVLVAGLVWLGWPNALARLGLRRVAPELYAWMVAGIAGHLLPLAAALPLALGLGGVALRLENLWSAARALAPGVLALAAGISIAALGFAHGASERGGATGLEALRSWRASPLFYLHWALLQQHVALGYFNARLRRGIAPGRHSRAAVALLNGLGFGWMHWPALELCVASAVCESWLAWHWQRAEARNLFASALAHALLASLYAEWLPLSMDVGP